MTKLDDLSEAIGQLRAEVRIMADQQKAADSSRGQIHKTLECLDRKIDAAGVKIASIDKRLEQVEEPVAEFSRWRERGVGAIMIISFVAASLGGLLVTFGKRIWAAVTGG